MVSDTVADSVQDRTYVADTLRISRLRELLQGIDGYQDGACQYADKANDHEELDKGEPACGLS